MQPFQLSKVGYFTKVVRTCTIEGSFTPNAAPQRNEMHRMGQLTTHEP